MTNLQGSCRHILDDDQSHSYFSLLTSLRTYARTATTNHAGLERATARNEDVRISQRIQIQESTHDEKKKHKTTVQFTVQSEEERVYC